MVLYGDGCIYHKVIFRLVIFRPFINECLECRVQESTPDGLKLTLGFYDDIVVWHDRFFDTTAYDQRKGLWFYQPDFQVDEDAIKTADQDERYKAARQQLMDAAEDTRLYFAVGELVRVRVIEEIFRDTGPTKPPKALAPAVGPHSQPQIAGTPEIEVSPYTVLCCCDEPGLGVIDWWRDEAEE